MDFYLNPENSQNRLIEEYNTYGSLVVAFDFDDTVYDFHKKDRIYSDVIDLIRKLKTLNCYLICWTGQEDLEFVSNYLKSNGIPFDSINENPPFHKSKSKKVYANVYLDDRAGLYQVYKELVNLVDWIETGEKYNLIESISEKIHNHWVIWAKELLVSEPNTSPERLMRWQNHCFKNYNNLSDEMKELDRRFAKEIISII